MADATQLTAEQRQRIEANRQRALALRAAKSAKSPSKPTNNTTVFQPKIGSGCSVGFQSQTTWSKSSSSPHVPSNTATTPGNNALYGARNGCVQTSNANMSCVPKSYTSSPIVPQKDVQSHTQQRTQEEINARRQKALALRAEKSALKSPGQVQSVGTIVPSVQRVQGTLPSQTKSNVFNPVNQGANSRGNVGTSSYQNQYGQDGSCGKGMRADAVAKTLGTNAPAFPQMKSSLKGICSLISRERFEVRITFHPAVVELFKSMPTRCYDATSKHWTFKLQDYFPLMEKLWRIDGVTIEPLPAPVRTAFSAQLYGKFQSVQIPEADFSQIDQGLVKTLMPFQREGVCFAIGRKGRVLLADDMGLGKTIQGICIACYYKKEWPVLVVTPSSVRFAWAEQFKKWVPSLSPDQIKVAVTGSDNTFGHVHITSYDLMVRKADEILNVGFQVVIMDESHLLKNYKTARCRAATPILKAAKRVILLSGTPALSRPMELFPQLAAVAPNIFTKFHEFGVRYCDGVKNNFAWDYTGSSNMKELQLLLEETIMIRRVKTDVIEQLPDKRREMIILDPAAIKMVKAMKESAELMSSGKLKGMERRGCLLTYFSETARAKVPAVKSYVLDLLESGKKFLVFAHHSEMLDALQDAIAQKSSVCHIRIDGNTPSEQRKVLCDKFMFNDDVKVALLSITAASTGLNLTAACLVVFAELFWNPGILTQAEDRVHRIGQRDSVNVQYLVAKGTADDYIWPLVQNKLDVLQSAGLTKDDFTTADTTEMGASKCDAKQRTILSYFEEDLFNQSDDLDEYFKDAIDDDMVMPNREGVGLTAIKAEDSTAPPCKKPKMPPTPPVKEEFDMEKEEWWT